MGFAFAAPGAVIIYGRPSRKENGIISLAGPLTNLILGGLFLGISIPFFLFTINTVGSGLLFIGLINLFIGCFNMLPVMPFDGAKIWRWSKFTYIIMISLLLPPVFIYLFLPSIVNALLG